MLLFLVAQILFLSSHLFRLQEVEVHGNVRLTRAAILRQAALPEGTYLWALSPRRITQRLQGLRELRSAAVSLALPGRVLLEVNERHPVILVSGNRGTWFEADAEGVLLGPSSTLPRLKLVTLEATRGRIGPAPIRLVRTRQWLEPNLPAPPTAYMLDETVRPSSRLLGTPDPDRAGAGNGLQDACPQSAGRPTQIRGAACGRDRPALFLTRRPTTEARAGPQSGDLSRRVSNADQARPGPPRGGRAGRPEGH